MLTKISIKNFRILKDLSLTDLHRINLIAGPNGSGKTSFLEAGFLLAAAGKPQYFLDPNIIRGPSQDLDIVLLNSDKPWQELFSNLDQSNPIEVTGQHQKHGTLKLKIEMGRSQFMEFKLGSRNKAINSGQSQRVQRVKKLLPTAFDALALDLSYIEGKKSEQKKSNSIEWP